MGKNIPLVPVPTSVEDASTLESLFASTLSSIQDPKDASGPIKHAVEAIDNILRQGDDVFEDGD